MNSRGSIRPYICILLLIICGYVGFKFAMPFYRYQALKSDAVAIARLSYSTPDKYRRLFYERAKTLHVDIEPSDVYVSIQNNTVNIATSWTEVVDLMGLYQYELHFNIDVEE